MEVIVTDSAQELVRTHGNRVYVWLRASHCCGGGQTLDAAFEPPRGREFRPVDNSAGIEVHMPAHLGRLPDELHLDVQRWPRRIRAYWNGCAWVV